MTLEQQIEEAILSTLVVENKESIVKYCVPKIMAIVEKYGSEMQKRVWTDEGLDSVDGLTAILQAKLHKKYEENDKA